MRSSALVNLVFALIVLAPVIIQVLAAHPAQAATSTLYVRAGSSGAGTSWADAYGNLQDALAAATPGPDDTVHIWVAAGVYYPDSGGGQVDNDRTAHFPLTNNVEIAGGFPPTGNPILADRDPSRYQTVLSGDIDGNDDQQPVITDLASETNNLNNSYRVVIAENVDTSAVLDGVTITAGNANGTFTSPCGPACGSGVYNDNSAATFANVTITGNTATDRGGGVYSDSSAATFANVTITGNTADLYGGGMYTVSDTTTFTNVTMTGNTATYGGGVFNVGGTARFVHARILGNEAAEGGGVFHGGSNASFTNVLLTGNQATGATSGTVGGGGMVNNSNSNPELVNVTIAGNFSSDDGGGMVNAEDSDPSITNSIIWGNASNASGDQVQNVSGSGSTPTYDFSLVEDETLGGTNLDGIDPTNDPQFVNPIAAVSTNTPTTNGDYHLQQGSPLINAGNGVAVPGSVTNDLDMTPRFVGSPGTVDLGPYELQCPTTNPALAYVDAEADGANTGLDWTNAMPNLQSALALTDRCSMPRISEVWVAQGIYAPDSGGTAMPNDRHATFTLRDNLQVYGGFAGNETQRSQRDPSSNLTILSGDIDGNDSQRPIVTDPNASSITGTRSNSYHVVTADGVTSKTILDGFTITAGYAENNSNPDEGGAGMLITNNAAPQLEQLTLQGNVAEFGAGIHSHASQPHLMNVTIANNTAGSTGGGMDIVESSTPELTNVTIIGNAAKGGGGLFIRDSTPGLINVQITGNLARDVGGGIDILNSNPSLTNATIAGNRAANAGGGIANETGSDTTLVNTVIAGNTAPANDQIDNAATLGLADSLIADGCPMSVTCTDVLEADPAFDAPRPAADAPTAMGDYRLQASSPAIDQGDTSALPAAITTDLAGTARIVDGDGDTNADVDMGAYEYIPQTLFIPLVRP
jgi:hypothetical protein